MSTAHATDGGRLDERSIRRIAGLSLVGASVEWFDFFLYGTAAALVFPALFFPHADPSSGVLLSFATFGVGFVARPLGGVLWGHFGDRVGRKRAFLAALTTMAVGSVLIGLLPGYAAIGVAAPILLTVLRFVQGLAVGGQWGGAVLLATEYAPAHRRGFYGSFAQRRSSATAGGSRSSPASCWSRSRCTPSVGWRTRRRSSGCSGWPPSSTATPG